MRSGERATVVGTKRVKLPKGPSSLECGFATQWRIFASRSLGEAEHRFDSGRKWRFDFAWPSEKVAVEIHGGTRTGGRHVRGDGIRDDVRKLNAAVLQGWRVLIYTTDDLSERPAAVVAEVELLLATKGVANHAD